MTTLAAVRSEVYLLTNRPDLVNETTTAVKAATLKVHQMDYFYRDLYETGIVFTTEEYVQQLNYKQILPLWRALSYMRKYDAVGLAAGKEFDIIAPTEALDSYAIDRKDVMYAAGAVFNIKSSTAFQYALLGCYLNPDVTEAGYNSWIADEHLYAIVYEAARVVFKTIGYDEQAAVYEKLVQEQYATVRISQITSVGS